jgi:hypothetical protein
MIAPKHSLVIEATEDPNFFGFYSPDLHASSQSPRGRARLSTTTKSQWGTTTDMLDLITRAPTTEHAQC